MAGYRAVAALVIAKDADGSDVYIYQGAPVPEGVPSDEIERLLEGEFIASVEDPEEESPDFPEGEPTADWTVKQLSAYAETLSIDLGDAKKKDEIIAAIAAASA